MGRVTYVMVHSAFLALLALTVSCTSPALETSRDFSADSYKAFTRSGIEAALAQANFSSDVRRGCLDSLATNLERQAVEIPKLLDSEQSISAVFFFGSDYISLTSIYAGSSRGKPSLVYQDLDGLRSITATDADLNKLHSMIASVVAGGIGNKEKVHTGLHESCAVFFSGNIRDGRFYALSSNELENEAMPASAAYKFMQSLVQREMEKKGSGSFTGKKGVRFIYR